MTCAETEPRAGWKGAVIRLLDELHLTRSFVDFYTYLRYLGQSELRARNARLLASGTPDGLPLPPPRLVYFVTGAYDLQRFLDNGTLGAECIRSVLRRNGYEIESLHRVLDFGCGCGRVMRHWAGVAGPEFHGTDYNPRLIEWCRASLPHGRFQLNTLGGGLGYADAYFGFVYAISVFTHFDLELQSFWIRELARILSSGGLLYMTTHGRSYREDLDPEQRRRFDAGELAVVRARDSGSNLCAAFHPEAWVRQHFAEYFEVLDFEPDGARDARQDVYLLRRR